MKKIFVSLFLALIAFSASAVSFQMKNDYQFYRNYFNPATRFFEDGVYIHGYADYMMNMPVLSGKEPLDLNFDLCVSRKNYTAFASVSNDQHSYFSNVCLTAGYNHIFDFGGSEHRLRIGGRAVLGINTIDFRHLPYMIPSDGERATILPSPDLDLGIAYSYRKFHIGLAMKNILAYEAKYKGVTYVSWPRSVFGDIRFDVDMAQGRLMFQPFFGAGFNQNIFFVIGADFTMFKDYRISYSFRGPDLSHNVNASVMICNRVGLNLGYSVSTAHAYSSIYGGITVRLAN